MDEITPRIVEFLSALKPEDLSDEVIDRVKYLLLDHLGVAIRGSLSDSSQAVYRMAERFAVGGSCTVIGTAQRSPAEYAAMANGCAAHAVELDDTHQASSLHPGVVIFPTAIALSERLDVDPKAFLISVVAGYEMITRLGMALQPKLHYKQGFHPTATCGVFGATVTAAKLLGMPKENMLSAVGIAGSMAAGSMEFLADGAWTKRLHPGLAAKNGITAAVLSAEGFFGPASILAGRDGFLFAYSQRPKPERVTAGLGETFEILRTSVKPYACCRYMQTPIDALIYLAETHDLRPDQVRSVRVAVLEAGWPLVCEPKERKYNPASIVDAQFSMPFGAATAIVRRKAGLDEFSEANIRSPETRAFMGKVVLEKDTRIDKNYPAEWGTRVEVSMINGSHFEHWMSHPKGDPENPLNWDELIAKFQTLAGPVVGEERCSEIVQAVRNLEDLRQLWKLTAQGTSR
ncbi:MAG TPA: MmgE/PrpD family protein [Bryobacteraceae bacterium]|nr:MmgE/PrpD family protein [Bryobacteraceae bacterium]